MYKVYAGSSLLYHPNMSSQGLSIYNPEITLDDNKFGTFKFSVPITNPLYDDLTKITTVISVYDDDELVFKGRILNDNQDFYNNKQVTCEGELAYLLDSVMRPQPISNLTVSQFLGLIIQNHNNLMPQDKQFQLGIVTVKSKNNLTFDYNSYDSAWSIINSYLLDIYGGHIVLRYENGTRYIDYLEDTNQVELDKTRIKAYISINGYWTSSDDSYSIAVPVEIGEKYVIIVDPYESEKVGSLLRYGFRNNNVPDGDSPSAPLSQWARTSPQDNHEIELSADKNYLIIQMQASKFADNLDKSYITVRKINKQRIQFGENLLDFSKYVSGENIFTELIPLGESHVEEKEDDEITVGSVLLDEFSDNILSKSKNETSPIFQMELKAILNSKSKSNKTTNITVTLGIRSKTGSVSWSGASTSKIYSRILVAGKQKVKTGIPSLSLSPSEEYTTIATWTGNVSNKSILIKGEFTNKYTNKDSKPQTSSIGSTVDILSLIQKTTYADIKSVNDGNDSLVNEEAENIYGKIVKVQQWPEILDPQMLKDKATEFMSKNANLELEFEVKALDLSLVDGSYQKITLGDFIRVISYANGIDEYFECTKVVYDLENPGNNKYTLGKRKSSFIETSLSSQEQSSIISDRISDVQNRLTETDNIVETINDAVEEIYASYASIEAMVDTIEATYADIDFANITTAAIDNLFANSATIAALDARYATIDFANIGQAAIDSLSTHFATIDLANISQAAITNLSADFATIDLANISQAAITNLSADFATIDLANISQAAITNLSAEFATIDLANIGQAAINNLSANFATIDLANISQAAITNLSADFATIDLANISQAAITNLSADFATIDLANINQGAFEKIFSNTLVADYAVLQDGTVTGSLKAVDISGDLITAGTIVADRLVISGPDGLYYQLNALGNGDLTSEQLSDPELQNALHGSNIVANSITASQIAAGTITGNEISANTITAGNIAANTITSVEIAAGTITANEIASQTITGDNIKAGTISADKFESTFTQIITDLENNVTNITNSIIIDPSNKLISIKSGEDSMSMNLTSSSLAFILGEISRLAWLDSAEGLGAPEISIGPPDTLENGEWISNIGQRWRITVSDDGTRFRVSRHKGVE